MHLHLVLEIVFNSPAYISLPNGDEYGLTQEHMCSQSSSIIYKQWERNVNAGIPVMVSMRSIPCLKYIDVQNIGALK